MGGGQGGGMDQTLDFAVGDQDLILVCDQMLMLLHFALTLCYLSYICMQRMIGCII